MIRNTVCEVDTCNSVSDICLPSCSRVVRGRCVAPADLSVFLLHHDSADRYHPYETVASGSLGSLGVLPMYSIGEKPVSEKRVSRLIPENHSSLFPRFSPLSDTPYLTDLHRLESGICRARNSEQIHEARIRDSTSRESFYGPAGTVSITDMRNSSVPGQTFSARRRYRALVHEAEERARRL